MTQLQTADAELVTDLNPLPVKLPDPAAPMEWVVGNVAALAMTAGTPQLVATPNVGRRFRLMGYQIGAAAATLCIVKSGAAKTERLRTGLMGISGNVTSPSGLELVGVPLGQAGDAVWIDTSGSTTIHGFLLLKEEVP